MTEKKETPAICVADLVDYQAGILRSRWIQLESGTDEYEVQSQIVGMLEEKEGRYKFAIYDYRNLPEACFEYTPRIRDLLAVADVVRNYGCQLVQAYLEYFDMEKLDLFEYFYDGTYKSREEYGHKRHLFNHPEQAQNGCEQVADFDYTNYMRELESEGKILCVELSDSQFAVFNTY